MAECAPTSNYTELCQRILENPHPNINMRTHKHTVWLSLWVASTASWSGRGWVEAGFQPQQHPGQHGAYREGAGQRECAEVALQEGQALDGGGRAVAGAGSGRRSWPEKEGLGSQGNHHHCWRYPSLQGRETERERLSYNMPDQM